MTCPTGKVTYATAAKAWREVGKICKWAHTHQARAYRCKACGQWHLTSSFRDPGRDAMRKAREERAA